MYINKETAQLILDAIAWSNDEWLEAIEEEWTDEVRLAVARNDFINFCHDRGIDGVEVEVSANDDR